MAEADEYNELYGDAGDVSNLATSYENVHPAANFDGPMQTVAGNLTVFEGPLQPPSKLYAEDDDFNIQLDQPDMAQEASGVPFVRAVPRVVAPMSSGRPSGTAAGVWQPRGSLHAYLPGQLPQSASYISRPLYVPAGATRIEQDDSAAFPMAAKPGQGIKLPGQTRVTPEEYREFLSLGHGHIFDLDIDRVVDAAWRMPGADPSDFFNYGMDVWNWKEYSSSVQQYRLEYRMQHKISTYEAEAEAGLDPDLPPELAAALAVERRQARNEMPSGRRAAGASAPHALGLPVHCFNDGSAQRAFRGPLMHSDGRAPPRAGILPVRPALHSDTMNGQSSLHGCMPGAEPVQQQDIGYQSREIQHLYGGQAGAPAQSQAMQGWDADFSSAPRPSEAFPLHFLPAPFVMGVSNMNGLPSPFGNVMPGPPPPSRPIDDSKFSSTQRLGNGEEPIADVERFPFDSLPDKHPVKRQRHADIPSGSLAMGMDAPVKLECHGVARDDKARESRTSDKRRDDDHDIRSRQHLSQRYHSSSRDQGIRQLKRDQRDESEGRRRHSRHDDVHPFEKQKAHRRDRSDSRERRNKSDRRR